MSNCQLEVALIFTGILLTICGSAYAVYFLLWSLGVV
jgi:hypothetical protein